MSSDSLAALKPYLSFFHPVTMWILLVVGALRHVSGSASPAGAVGGRRTQERTGEGSVCDSSPPNWLYTFGTNGDGGDREPILSPKDLAGKPLKDIEVFD